MCYEIPEAVQFFLFFFGMLGGMFFFAWIGMKMLNPKPSRLR